MSDGERRIRVSFGDVSRDTENYQRCDEFSFDERLMRAIPEPLPISAVCFGYNPVVNRSGEFGMSALVARILIS